MTVAPSNIRGARRVVQVPVKIEPLKRTANGALRVRGTAIVYNQATELFPGLREIIRPGALRDALAKPGRDLLLLYGHDRNRPLARESAGTLKIRDDGAGLHFDAELVDTTDGRDTIKQLEARLVKGCSFAFMPDEDGEEWTRNPDGSHTVDVHRIADIYELTLTADPAYPQTSAEVARAAIRQAVEQRRVEVRDRSPYGPTSYHSWFRDLLRVDDAQRTTRELERQGVIRHVPGRYVDMTIPVRGDGTLDDARARLASVQTRDVGSGALSALADLNTGVPQFIADTFQTAARPVATLWHTLPHLEIPNGFILPAGFNALGGYVSTGISAAVQTAENNAPGSTDIAGTAPSLKPATITAKTTVSRQLLDRGVSADVLIARDLGAAWGAQAETQLINGSGGSGQMLGLLNVSGVTAVTYVDATPTVAELWPILWQLRSKVATAAGLPPSVIAMHPRRFSWLNAATTTNSGWADFEESLDDVEVVESAAFPTTLGAGTEDAIVMVAPGAAVIADRTPQVIVDDHTPEKVTLAVWGYGALVGRLPVGIGSLTGTGLAAPAGF